VVAARYLLDTNVLSEPLRPQPDPQVVRRLRAHENAIATAAMVAHELLFGWAKLPASRKKEAIGTYLEDLLTELDVFPYDRDAARWHAHERSRLERLGRPVSYRDSQIAAVARVHGLILVTANVGDFSPISDLTVEDWRRS
jgi:tRNA(fMet)-specific endonuclease VapC